MGVICTTKDWEYIGEVKNGKPHGQGILKGDGKTPNEESLVKELLETY